MSTRKALSIASGLILGLAMLLPVAARADDYNQATRLTFSQPVEMPGNTVLPAGTYWFRLADIGSSRQLVRIYNADQSKQLAAYLAIPTERMATSGNTELKLINQPRNRPYALLSWFYPDRLIGHEFIFSPRQESRLSEESVITIMAHRANSHNKKEVIALRLPQQGPQAES